RAASSATRAAGRCSGSVSATARWCASRSRPCGMCAMADGTRRAILAALLANLSIAAAKFVAFAVTASASMFAEAIHPVADTGHQGLVFLGGHRARRAPTSEHPFGFGRERYFWAFIVALVLFTVGSLFALAEGIDKLVDPEPIESPLVAYVVLA